MRRFECVFLDMDGVLVNFIEGAFRAHGRVYKEQEYPIGLWEIADNWGITPQQFWDVIDEYPGFWQKLDPYPWMEQVIDIAKQLGEEVKLLTSPSKSPLCFSGKRFWHRQHVPQDIELIICKSKRFLAGPSRLLIDDGEHNVDPWRIAGGRAVLFPQRWNRDAQFSADPITHLSVLLGRIV